MKALAFYSIVLAFFLFVSAANATQNTCSEAYTEQFRITEMAQIPRYHQLLDKRDANVCFAAAAAQALDVNRYRRIAYSQAALEQFIPTSPLLMATRFYYLTNTPEGIFGGNANSVLQSAFDMGNCESPINEVENSLFGVSEETSALSTYTRHSASQFRETKELIDHILTASHLAAFNSTYQKCRIGEGSSTTDSRIYELSSYTGRADAGPAVSREDWLTSLNTASQNTTIGAQPVIISLCAEALAGQPFQIRETKPEDRTTSALDEPQPSTLPCSNHVVVVYGKRCRCENDCQVLIRDSYAYAEGEETPPIREHIYSHGYTTDFWISEEAVRNATVSVVHIINRRTTNSP